MSNVTIPNFNTPKEVVGLNTYQYTVQSANMHVADIRVDRRTGSAFTIAIQLNGTPVATNTVNPVDATNPQSSDSLRATMNCAVNDVISFVLTSSAPVDEQLQGCKAILNVHIGSGN